MTGPDTPGLRELAPGVWVWLGAEGRDGEANAGLVADDDGLTVVDTLMVRSQWEPFAAAVAEIAAALEHVVKRVVLTHAHIDHVGGTSAFRNAAVYATPVTSALLDQPLALDAYRAFMPAFAAEFDDLAEVGTRPVSHLIDDAASLTPRIEVLPAPGHTPGDLVVLVADADVCFAGDLCTFGVTPLAFQGDPAQWAETLGAIAELAEVVVPGHGRVGGPDDVRKVQAYLRHCVAGVIPSGPWDDWLERGHDPINLERAALLAAGDDEIPPSMRRAIGLPDN